MKYINLFEQFIANAVELVTEKREDVGKYNTVKKAIKAIKKEYGPTPTEQSVASFINDNYYDVTEVERGDDDPRANDKIADLVASYKFDIDDWEIAWADAQNESVVIEAKDMTLVDYLEILDNKFLDAMKAVSGENESDAAITPTRGDILQNFTLFRNYVSSLTKKYKGDKTKLSFLTEKVSEYESSISELVVTEAKAYKLKASEFGSNTFSAAYNVKGETTWRVHSTYAIDQVSGENDSSERDVVFFEAMPINNDIYIKIGGINNLKRTGSTVGDNFGTTIEEWKKDPKGIAKEASEFLTDATHLKWINKKARSQGQTIKWALNDDYSSVIEDLVNKSLGLTESLVTEAKNTIGLAFKEEQDYLDFKEFVAEQPRGAIRKNIGFDSKTKSWNVEMDVKVLDSIYGEGTPSNKESGWYGGLPDDFESVIIESTVTEGKIKYSKGKTYQSDGHWTVYVDSNSSGFDIRVNHSAGWRLDPHDKKEETLELLDNGRQRATIYFKSGNIDKFAQQMFDLNDRTTNGNQTKLTAKDYADIIRVWIDKKMANESMVTEARNYKERPDGDHMVKATVCYLKPMTRQRECKAIYFKSKHDALGFKGNVKGFPKGAAVEAIKESKTKYTTDFTSFINESKNEVNDKQLANLQKDIAKINKNIKVYISTHPITKGKLSIELGADHNNEDEIDQINSLLKKHTGDWRTGTMFNEAVKVTPESDVKIDDYTSDNGEEIKAVEIVGAISSSETEDEFLDYFYDAYGQGAFTETDTATLVKYYNEYVEEVTAQETEDEEEAEKAEGGDDELDMDI